MAYRWEIHEVEDGALVAVRAAHLDDGAALMLVDDLSELTLDGGRLNVYLDLGDVDILSSGALAQLLVLDRKLRAAGGRLALFSLNPLVTELLRLSHLAGLLDVRGVPLPRRDA